MRLTDRFRAIFLDLDGVVYVGDVAIPGAAETISELRRDGCHIRFMTNDPRPSRADVASRLGAIGVQASVAEIVTSGWVSAEVLKAMGMRTVFVVGSDALRLELIHAGLRVLDHEPVDAVVVGCHRSVGYTQIRDAANRVRDGAAFIATNDDALFPAPCGPLPGTGVIVAAVRTATGVTPRVVGKPQSPMFEAAAADLPADTLALMVGDTPEADIEGAHRAGLPAVLVNAIGLPRNLPPWCRPDAVIRSLPALLQLDADSLRSWADTGQPPPQRISPCVGAVILDRRERVLMVRRRDNALWALPTGHVEPGETWTQAVTREIEEEVGLRLTQPRLRGLYSHPSSQVVSFPDGRTEHFVAACFLVHATHTDMALEPAEVTDARFFPINRLPRPRVGSHEQWIKDALAPTTAPAVR